MESVEIILSLMATIIGLAVMVLSFLVKIIKNAKARKCAEQLLKVAGAIMPFIKEAEKFTSYTGAEKKAYVMTKANQFAISNRIPFKDAEVSAKIEELIELTKEINAHPTARKTVEIIHEPANIVKNQDWLK